MADQQPSGSYGEAVTAATFVQQLGDKTPDAIYKALLELERY